MMNMQKPRLTDEEKPLGRAALLADHDTLVWIQPAAGRRNRRGDGAEGRYGATVARPRAPIFSTLSVAGLVQRETAMGTKLTMTQIVAPLACR